MLTRTRISRDSLKQPNQESSDRATAYRIWPASINPFCNFRVSRRGNCQEPQGDALRTRVQACRVPSCCCTHYFPQNRGKRKPRRMKKARGRPWLLEDGLNGGRVNARTCPDGPRSSEPWGDCCYGADYSDAPRLDAANWTVNGSIRVVFGSPECRKFSQWPVTGWL